MGMDKEARKRLLAKVESGEHLERRERKKLNRELYKMKRRENRNNNRKIKRRTESMRKKEEKLRKMEMGPEAFSEYVAQNHFKRYHWTKNNSNASDAQSMPPPNYASGSNLERTHMKYHNLPPLHITDHSKRSKGHKKHKKNKKSNKDTKPVIVEKKEENINEQDFTDDIQFNESADIPLELMNVPKKMTPMTKEEWDAKQSVVRRVLDEETGRYRLIKGDGEVLEEIVSRDRHKEINRQATNADGAFFQSQTVTKKF